MQEYQKKLEVDFSFYVLRALPVYLAKTGQRVEKLYELIHYVHEQNARRISTGMLNDMLSLRHRAGAAALV
jgi:GTP-binding protein